MLEEKKKNTPENKKPPQAAAAGGQRCWRDGVMCLDMHKAASVLLNFGTAISL